MDCHDEGDECEQEAKGRRKMRLVAVSQIWAGDEPFANEEKEGAKMSGKVITEDESNEKRLLFFHFEKRRKAAGSRPSSRWKTMRSNDVEKKAKRRMNDRKMSGKKEEDE